MSEWKESMLANLVEVDPEQLDSSIDSDFSFFYIDIGSVYPGCINYPIHPIAFKDAPSRARKVLRYNDILMSNVRPNLKAFAHFKRKSRMDFIASTGFSILRARPNTDINFIFHTLFSNEIEKQIDTLVVGSNYPAINSSDVRKLKVKTPTLYEQRRIAHILSTTDSVIEKTQAAIAKYKAIKQGMLHDLFTRGIDLANGKLRPTYEEAPELYKEGKLGWVPREWEENRLEQICSMKSGEGITSKSIQNISDFPVFGGNGLRGYATTYTHDGEYTLIGRQGALCGNITRVSGRFYASEHAVVVTVEKGIDVDWVSQKLDTMNLNQYSEASAQPGLSVNKIMRLIVAKPPYPEQEKIAERLIIMDNKLHSEQTYLQKLQQIKRGLMEDLLSGRKRVKTETELKHYKTN